MKTYSNGFFIALSALVIALVCFGLVVSGVIGSETVIKADLPDNVQPGQEFDLPVTITDVVGFDAGQFDIRYDPAIIEITGYSKGMIGDTEIDVSHSFLKEDGLWRTVVNVPNVPGVDGDGTLVVLDCRALAEGEAEVGIGWVDNETGEWVSAFINDNMAIEIQAEYLGDPTLFYPQTEGPILPIDPLAEFILFVAAIVFAIWSRQSWWHPEVSLDWLNRMSQRLLRNRSFRL